MIYVFYFGILIDLYSKMISFIKIDEKLKENIVSY